MPVPRRRPPSTPPLPQWRAAVDSGSLLKADLSSSGLASTNSASSASIATVMAFAGPGPETINGRLAMLGFVAAVAAELSSGESVLKQWADEPALITCAFAVFIAGSLVPMLAGGGAAAESLGPFTPAAEKTNGRAAMIGFASLLAIEAVRGGVALF